MSIHISFECNNKTCQANLVEGKKDGPTVKINGIDFTMIKGHVMDEKLEKVLHQIINRKFESVTDLKSYIGKIEGCSHVDVVDKSHRTGVEILFGKSIESKKESLQQKQKSLQAFQKQVAEQYWNTYIEGQSGGDKDHSMLKSAVMRPSENKDRVSSDFDKAIENKDKELFCSCFRNLEFYQIYPIVQGEELKNIKLPGTNSDPVDLSKFEGLTSDIKNVLKERGFSGIVALSDGKNELLVASDEFNEISTPMAIHSVGKIATGMLALRLIEEGILKEKDLEEPIRLDQKVMKALPIPVQERLAQTTLKDVMLHQSGLKDYLKNYQDDIQNKLDLQEKPPIINSCEDLLVYAEEDLIALKEGETHLSEDEQHYSNLGLLLVGLSLEHLVSEHEKKPVSFEEALSHYVLKPAGIEVFTPMMPEKGQHNPEDSMAAYLYGGPGGGHWSTAQDLLKLGTWIGGKSEETTFGELLKNHGREFYNNGNVWHAGSISSASAHLTHLGDQGLTVAVLSTTKGFCQATAVAEMIQDHLII